jgi:8-oxo-dGTP diphosphatase
MHSELRVACAIIFMSNRIIITQRSESMRLPLKWEFPGGKIEINESAEECIHREIFEELNIQINILEKLNNSIYKYEDHKVCLIPFVVEYVTGEIRLKEHKQYKVISKEALNEFDFAQADLPIIKSFLDLY